MLFNRIKRKAAVEVLELLSLDLVLDDNITAEEFAKVNPHIIKYIKKLEK